MQQCTITQLQLKALHLKYLKSNTYKSLFVSNNTYILRLSQSILLDYLFLILFLFLIYVLCMKTLIC